MALVPVLLTSNVTYDGYLSELREYTPMRAGAGLACYRLCHECQLINPHQWGEKDTVR